MTLAIAWLDVSREIRPGWLNVFGDPQPVIVKDFVKSQTHHWYEACFIPSSADLPAAERVVRRFIDLQGPDLNEGLVFREFEEFAPLASHSRSGMPLTREYRMFFLDGVPILSAEYWDEGDYAGSAPPLDEIRAVASRIPSRFFTVDVAQHVDGRWRIVEIGDGQVAGLPERADPDQFYSTLVEFLHRTGGLKSTSTFVGPYGTRNGRPQRP